MISSSKNQVYSHQFLNNTRNQKNYSNFVARHVKIGNFVNYNGKLVKIIKILQQSLRVRLPSGDLELVDFWEIDFLSDSDLLPSTRAKATQPPNFPPNHNPNYGNLLNAVLLLEELFSYLNKGFN